MLSIEDNIRVSYPEVKMGILVMQDVIYFSSCKEEIINTIIGDIHQKYEHLDRKGLKELHPIKAYVTYYKRFGNSFHLLSQLESLLKGEKSIQFKSGLLQAMFLLEVFLQQQEQRCWRFFAKVLWSLIINNPIILPE